MFFSQIVLAQETQGFEAPGWARAISGLWIIVLVAAFILISVALIARERYVLYAGIIVLYISTILIINQNLKLFSLVLKNTARNKNN